MHRRRRYVARHVDATIAAFLETEPALMLSGPRACGKTTTALRWARSTARLDVPGQAAVFAGDPDAALAAFDRRPLLIDEWQEVPAVLGAVKRSVDGGAAPGSFILTGSVRAALRDRTWPGTGRVAEVQLGPLTVAELEGGSTDLLTDLLTGRLPASKHYSDPPDLLSYVRRALAGGFPVPVLERSGNDRAEWYRRYVSEIASRDVLSILRRADPDRMRRYIEAYALNSGGVVDDKTIFDAAGINRRTAEGYESVLERLFVTERLPAWSGGRLARLVDRPKRFVADPALMAAAANLGERDVIGDGDLLGRLIETFVVAQIRGQLRALHRDVRAFHLRTKSGRQEIDLILEAPGRRVVGIEVKATAAPSRDDARHLMWLHDRIGDAFTAGVVFHTGPAAFPLGERLSAIPICALWR